MTINRNSVIAKILRFFLCDKDEYSIIEVLGLFIFLLGISILLGVFVVQVWFITEPITEEFSGQLEVPLASYIVTTLMVLCVLSGFALSTYLSFKYIDKIIEIIWILSSRLESLISDVKIRIR